MNSVVQIRCYFSLAFAAVCSQVLVFYYLSTATTIGLSVKFYNRLPVQIRGMTDVYIVVLNVQ